MIQMRRMGISVLVEIQKEEQLIKQVKKQKLSLKHKMSGQRFVKKGLILGKRKQLSLPNLMVGISVFNLKLLGHTMVNQ